MGRRPRCSYPQIAASLLKLARTLGADHEHPAPEQRDQLIHELEWAATTVLHWGRPAPTPPVKRGK